MFVSVSIAAEILGVSPDTLRRWDRTGRLPAGRSEGGHRQYEVSELEQYAQANGLRPSVPLQYQIDVLSERVAILEEIIRKQA